MVFPGLLCSHGCTQSAIEAQGSGLKCRKEELICLKFHFVSRFAYLCATQLQDDIQSSEFHCHCLVWIVDPVCALKTPCDDYTIRQEYHYVVVWHNSSSRINWVDLNECQKKPPEQLTSFLFCYSFLSLNRFNRQISEEQSASFRLVAPFRCIKVTQNNWYVLETVPFEFGLKRSDFQAVFGL